MDGETIRAILQYEQLREQRPTQDTADDAAEPRKCKVCGQPLPIEPEAKSGRPKEYCTECIPMRIKERQRNVQRQRRQ